MPEVWQQPRTVFLGLWPIKDAPDKASALRDDTRLEEEINDGAAAWLRSTLRPSRFSPGFFLADVAGPDGDVALLHRDPHDQTLDICGGYVGPSLWVEHNVRGRGLSAELILAKAALCDGRLSPENYTTAGYEAHASAHRLAVQTALANGDAVPADVLRDYPELRDEAPLQNSGHVLPVADPAEATLSMGRRR